MWRHTGRKIAFQALYSWQYDVSREDILTFYWVESKSDTGKPKAKIVEFAAQLVTGVIGCCDRIDRVIQNQLENWKINRINNVDMAILRLGVYSLLYLEEVPPIVSINEAVLLAKAYGNADSYRFVNGILDGIWRRHQTPVKVQDHKG